MAAAFAYNAPMRMDFAETPSDDAPPAVSKPQETGEPTAAARVKEFVRDGWTSLENDDPQRAIQHFRRALRLRPDHHGARLGVVESLKARHPIYRWLLARSFALSRLPPVAQFGLMLVAFFALRVISSVAAGVPAWAPFLWPLLITIFAICILSGLASPIFSMLLSLDPDGREALNDGERRGANLLLYTLLLPLPLLGWSILTNNGLGIVVWILLSMVALPASAIYRYAAGWPRAVMIAVTLLLFVPLLPLLVSVFAELPWLPAQRRAVLIGAAVYALLGAQVFAAVLQSVRPHQSAHG
jgi:hypothetical protein